MTAPPPKRPVLTCRRKHRHPDELTARASAMHSIATYGNAKSLYVYKCPECRGWHLTRGSHRNGSKVTIHDPVAEERDSRLEGFENVCE